jgi:hypothetical protein
MLRQNLQTLQKLTAMLRMLFAVSILMLIFSRAPSLAQENSGDGPNFNRDVRPVLSRNCFPCHGPDEDERKADLRLDVREDAAKAGAFDSGAPANSELLRRILSSDPDEQMPPPNSGHTLTESQKKQLQDWVLGGAKYEKHWAFVAPNRPALPSVKNTDWPRNSIDRFLLARLEREGLKPSAEADQYTLARRVYLDLIGLPPTMEEAEAFVNDKDPKAFENLVDRLLASKRYGERWGRLWLDLARYSDTNGYEKDRPRSIWPYRDWVIHALNADMPFDQFTIEQLAGDMLPDATISQRIATGFHRNTMLNEEGGIDPNEYRFYAMVDRVATTGSVWLGLTFGCAQCHTHKYDPITHSDYYRMFALLNNADEPDLSVSDPTIDKRRAELQAQIENEIAGLPAKFPPEPGGGTEEELRQSHLDVRFEKWLKAEREKATAWHALKPHELTSNLPKLELLDDGSIFSSGDITKRDVYTLKVDLGKQSGLKPDQPITALRLEVIPDPRLPEGGPGRAFYEGRKGDFFLSELAVTTTSLLPPAGGEGGRRPDEGGVNERAGEQSKNSPSPSPQPSPPKRAQDKTKSAPGERGLARGPARRRVRFKSGSVSFGKISIGNGTAEAKNVFDGEGSTGWSTSTKPGEHHQLVLNFEKPLAPKGEVTIEMTFERHFAASLGRFRISATTKTGEVAASQLPVEIERLLVTSPDSADRFALTKLKRQFLLVTPQLAKARKKLDGLRNQIPKSQYTMVFLERPADNPRPTHRHHRGEFLSTREEISPSLPSLFPSFKNGVNANRLNFARWLVSEQNPLVARVTVNRAWRAFFGTGIVETSADFGTQSNPPSHPELLDWLAVEFMANGWSMKKLHRLIVTSSAYRQSSRLTPELLKRDPQNRLLARGPRFRVDAETVRDIMLKSSGLLTTKLGGPSVYPPQPTSVTALAYGGAKWPVSKGEDRYRRSLYTFNKRTAPYAAYTVFDGPTGENCLPRRNRSNTPLQALTLLNDEMFLEMARSLGTTAAKRDGELSDRAGWIFQRLLTRAPSKDELASLIRYVTAQKSRLDAKEIEATKIGGVNASSETAALTMLARSLMNLDEVITKQ